MLCIIKSNTTKDRDIGERGEQLCNRDDSLSDRGSGGGIDVTSDDFGREGGLVSGGGLKIGGGLWPGHRGLWFACVDLTVLA